MLFVHCLIASSFVVQLSRGQNNQWGYGQSEPKFAQPPSCLCEVGGEIGDCGCDVESVEDYNARLIYPLLQQLRHSEEFKYYRVNLKGSCPFWQMDGRCKLQSCAIKTTSSFNYGSNAKSKEREIHDSDEQCSETISNGKSSEQTSEAKVDEKFCTNNLQEQKQQECCDHSHEYVTHSRVDGYAKKSVWLLRDEFGSGRSEGDEIVDLTSNPEGNTGYFGPSANRVWGSIYKENCFKVEPKQNSNDATSVNSPPSLNQCDVMSSRTMNQVCAEKRLFYRLLSGLHSSVGVHLAAKYPVRSMFGQVDYRPNATEFARIFDPQLTYKEGPHRLKNMYLLYLVEMRALLKSAPLLSQMEMYESTNSNGETHEMLQLLMQYLSSFPKHFDEHALFQSHEFLSLKQEYSAKLDNISRILDCVECDKCRLWAKLQLDGLHTALRVLFLESPTEEAGQSEQRKGATGTTTDESSQGVHDNSANGKDYFSAPGISQCPKLARNEVVALFNAFTQIAESIYYVHYFRDEY